jgi:hypothetical protein
MSDINLFRRFGLSDIFEISIYDMGKNIPVVRKNLFF